jgi:hypothetical protein
VRFRLEALYISTRTYPMACSFADGISTLDFSIKVVLFCIMIAPLFMPGRDDFALADPIVCAMVFAETGIMGLELS